MVEYIPPPEDLSGLNPIQRYMQKGSLEWQDYLRLVVIVAAYWMIRPYIHKLFQRFSGPEFQDGYQEQLEYQQRRAKAAIGANEIRDGQKKEKEVTVGGDVVGDGALTSGREKGAESEVKSRKAQKTQRQTASAADEPEIDKVLDWEDERPENLDPDQAAEGQEDIKAWVDKYVQ